MFYRLLDLAKENSAEARGTLMLGLADILIQNIEKRSEEELRLFGDITLLLYKSAPKYDRASLSRRVAKESRTPVDLAMELAKDQLAIAMPVLEYYNSFGEKNLLSLARKLGDEHLQVMARRVDLNTRVSDTLVRRGTRNVHRILAGNREIRMSQIALQALVRNAVKDVVLREDLALRTDLTPKVCNQLIQQVDGTTKTRLKRVVQGGMTKAEMDTLARLRDLRRLHGTKIDQLDIKKLWPYVKAAGVSFDELIMLLLQDDRLGHVADLLGLYSRTSSTKARSAIFNGDIDQVIAMAQATGLSENVFSLLVQSRCKHLRMPDSQATEWIGAYLEAEAARNKPDPGRKSNAFAANRRRIKRKPAPAQRHVAI